SKTAAAVAAFQRVRGLVMDGEVGPQTAAALGIQI
ncbi:MAG: peptidoglycan-binding protein, partial [Bauldia sp.]